MKRIVLFMVCIFVLPAIFAEASIKEKNDQLVQAAERGNLIGVQDALNGGADVNAKNNTGVTVLMRASYGGYTYGRYAEVVKLLLDKGADINVKNSKGETALMMAKDKGKDVKNSKGKTALDVVKDKGKAEIVGILEKAGAKE